MLNLLVKMTTSRVPQRPIAGGTNYGLRPRMFTYWRVGDGTTESFELDFWIERAGEYHCEPPHDYPITSYQLERWTRVFFITQGRAHWRSNQDILLLKPGDVLVLPPGQAGQYRCLEPHQYHWFALVGNWPSIWGKHQEVKHWSPGLDTELETSFVNLRETLILGQTGHALQALSHFYTIFGRIHTLSHQATPSASYPETVRNALIYLQENCTTPFQAAKTAAAVHVSPSHLRALFEKWVGESPKRYHTRCRIYRAKQLLAQQSLSVEIIAGEVGFSDVSAFSRVFKQMTGVSPTQYVKGG